MFHRVLLMGQKGSIGGGGELRNLGFRFVHGVSVCVYICSSVHAEGELEDNFQESFLSSLRGFLGLNSDHLTQHHQVPLATEP